MRYSPFTGTSRDHDIGTFCFTGTLSTKAYRGLPHRIHNEALQSFDAHLKSPLQVEQSPPYHMDPNQELAFLELRR